MIVMSQNSYITLTPRQVSNYRRNGFLILKDLLSAEEVESFLAHQKNRPREFDLELRSHVVDPQWKSVAMHPNVAGVVAQLLGGIPKIVQTMYLAKKAGEDKVGTALHQDTHYLPSEPNTLMACWIAMNDTGADNGGLCVVPGSHLEPLRTTHQSSGGEHANWSTTHRMRDRDGREWEQEMYSFEIDGLSLESVHKLEVKRGGGVFFTGMTIHGSYANHSATQDRLAFAVHYVRDDTWVLRADVQDAVAVDEHALKAEQGAPADADKPRR